MKIYIENFTILLNKHITNKDIDTYGFRVMCYLLMLSDNDGTCYPSYKNIKGLTKENLRNNRSDLELVLSMLAEATTTEISKREQPTKTSVIALLNKSF